MRDENFFQLCSEFIKEFYKSDVLREMFNVAGADIRFIVFEIEKEVEKLYSYQKLKEYMKNEPTISKHIENMIGLWSYRINLNEWSYIKYIIERQSRYSAGKFLLDYDKFEADYSKLEGFFIMTIS